MEPQNLRHHQRQQRVKVETEEGESRFALLEKVDNLSAYSPTGREGCRQGARGQGCQVLVTEKCQTLF